MERVGLAPGTEIGGYRVVAPLGHGGSGAVYRALDGDDRLVALKLLHPHLGEDPAARERLSREVATLQKVRHPAIARVLDAEIEQSDAFVVTELVEGDDLGAWVRSHGPLPADELATVAEQLRAALAVVHAAGILHRDVTPSNVLMSERGPVLIDFGIAHGTEDARVTSTGLVSGTAGYVAPELLEGADPTPASDWWAWAAVCAYAATGRPPFGAGPARAVLTRSRAGDADLGGLDARTTAALDAALAPDPAERATPDEVVATLDAAAAGGGTVVLPAGTAAARDGRTALLGTGDGPEGDTRVLDPADDEPADTRVLDPDGDEAADLADDDVDDLEADDDDHGDDAYDDPADAYDHLDDDAYPAHGPDADPDLHDPDADADHAPYAPPRRAGSVLALALLLLALGATRPGVALVVAAALAVVARGIGLAASAVAEGRRSRAGAVLLAPWYLVRAVVGVLPAALVAASLVVVVGGVGWWALDTGRVVVAEREGPSELAANAAWVAPAVLVVAVAVGLLVLWFGPTSRRTRAGARWALDGLAPGGAGASAVVLVALAGAAAFVILVALGHHTVWWPLPGPPDLR